MADGHAKIDPQESADGYRKRRFSFDEFWKLWADGTLEAGDESLRFELWEGDIRMVPPSGHLHSNAQGQLAARLISELARLKLIDTFKVGFGAGFRLAGETFVAPDLAVLPKSAPADGEFWPVSAAQLLVETSRSTLRGDLTFKRDKYAAAGIPEYWVQDVENQRLHIFRDPASGAFTEHQQLEGEATISPLFEPRITLLVAELF